MRPQLDGARSRDAAVRAMKRAMWVPLTTLLAILLSGGCLQRPLCADGSGPPEQGCSPKTTNVVVDELEQKRVDKIDLLFAIDNSASMADKQAFLREAVPDLVGHLVQPQCVSEAGPVAPLADGSCPPGSGRAFEPVTDVHIAVVSSSLEPELCPLSSNEEIADRGHLVGGRPRALHLGLANGPEGVPGFLQWNPDVLSGQTLTDLTETFDNLVDAVGDTGCGFESSLESWYRFLVDPAPPASIEMFECGGGMCAQPVGLDTALLAQRRAFLRPDSLVAIILLTDENDCSIQMQGPAMEVANRNRPLRSAASVCATNPNEPCCYSCDFQPPSGCAPDPACTEAQSPTDAFALRCFDQKRRYGFDFLYPTDRYVNALTELRLCTERPDLSAEGCSPEALVNNPLFHDPDTGIATRSTDLVFYAGIVGVPYQDIAATETADGEPVPPGLLRFKTAGQMAAEGDQTWDLILGQPDNPQGPVLPRDAHMWESVDPRLGGTSPATGVPLQGPGSGVLADPVNGHEWLPPLPAPNETRTDLQYACIFELPEERTCEDPDDITCDCTQTEIDGQNPLCQAADGSYGRTQRYGKAYPGLRHLEVLRDFGDNAIVASICAKEALDDEAPDYGYRPAIDAIGERLAEALNGQCLPRPLAVTQLANGEQRASCEIVEVLPDPARGCDPARGRSPLNPALVDAALARMKSLERCGEGTSLPCSPSSFSLCEIAEADSRCLTESPGDALGWCYVDPERGFGSEALVKDCEATDRRLLRFVDPKSQTPATGATVLVACRGAQLE